MNKVLKWILIVLLGLVALGVIAGIVFAFLGVGHGYYMMRPGFRMMQPYGYNTFSPVRSIFGGILGFGVFVLVIVGIVWLVSALVRGNRPAQMTQPQQPVAPARTCSNCGKPAQEDWKTCPDCGNPLS